MIEAIIGMIGLCLGIAMLVGGILGWIFHHIGKPAPEISITDNSKLTSDLSAARKECVECLKTRESLEARIKSLESELATKKAAALTDDTPIVIKAEPPVAPPAAVTYETSHFLKAAPTAAAVAASAEKAGEALGLIAEHDNLEEIFGVGPKLATLLHGLGITRFKQIALWTDADIDRIDAHLAEFQGRIRRENWVQSARECHFKKYGEWL